MTVKPVPRPPNLPNMGWRDVFRAMRQLTFGAHHEPVARSKKLYAALVLMWEDIAPRIWPYGVALFAFIAGALFELPSQLPGLLHSLLLAGLAAYFIEGMVKLVRDLRWPSDREIYHRIELDSELPHRPLTSLQDQIMPGADAYQQEWWQVYRQYVATHLKRLQVNMPRFGFAPFDPYAFRSVLLLFVVIGVMHAGRDTENRILHALRPEVPSASSLLESLTVWVRPPEYTKLPQIPLKADLKTVTEIPEQSQVYVQFSGVKSNPAFYIDNDKQDLTELNDNTYQANVTIDKATEIRAYLGWQTLGKWPVQVIADTPPSIDWDGDMYATSRAALRIGYKGSDDYGITQAFAEISKPGEKEIITLKLPVFTVGKNEVKNSSYHDIAHHRWAGQKVNVRLIAYDARDHKTISALHETTLPERVFEHPLAKKIGGLRKEFMEGRLARIDLSGALEDILEYPQSFAYDAKVTLATRVAQRRADLADDNSQDQNIADLLWDVALRLEDNGISLAERDLRTLEQALQDAMARGASQAEIDNLLDQFEEAMSNYLNAMYEQMMQEDMEDLPALDTSASSIEVEDIDRLLTQIRQLMRSGNTEEAQKLLSKLQEMMANVRQNQGQQSESAKKAMELIKKVQGLIRDQQLLLDYSAANLIEHTKIPPAALAKIKKDQPPVGKGLKDFLDQIGKMGAPKIEAFDKATASIKSVIGAVNDAKQPDKTRRENILLHEAESLEQMRLGLQELMKNMQNSGSGGQMRAGSGRQDPFGRTRPGQGPLDDPDVRVPGVQELQQTREILDELQRRSGDFGRPEIERDYIKRLLRRF